MVVQQHIFRLDVAMRYFQLMHILEARDNLDKIVMSLELVFTEFDMYLHFGIHDVVEKLTLGRILHDNENIVLCLNYFIHLGD